MSRIAAWLASAASVLWLATTPSRALDSAAPGREANVGPAQQPADPEARVTDNADELRAWLGDAKGPTRIGLRPGVYTGNFVVQRPLVLRGQLGAVLDGAGQGTVLSIESDDVVVDNLIVRGSGHSQTREDAGVRAKGARVRISGVRVQDALFGIALGPCPHCIIERCHVYGDPRAHELRGDGIKLWESSDSIVRDSVVDNMRDVVVWYSRRVALERLVVHGSRYGAHFMYAHDSSVRGSRIVDNVVGVFVMYSSRLHVEGNVLAGAHGPAGLAIGFKDSEGAHVTDNWLVANTTGSYLDATTPLLSAPIVFARNVFALNDVALRFHVVGSGLFFTDNDFRHNAELVDVEGGGDALAVHFEHNFFSDYAGYDLDEDGRGDVAHQVKRLSGALIDSRPMLALFRGTAALGLLDVVANAAPVFANRLMLSDANPRIHPRRPL